jgi:5-methylcytosine-specific restriction endonuclease McrA
MNMSVADDFWAPRDCLIPRFPELDLAIDHLAEAADAVLSDDIDLARNHLRQANVPKLRNLAVRAMGPNDHELHRLRHAQLPPKSTKPQLRMPGQAVTASVFERDGWRCRFCGVRVVVPAARSALACAVSDALCWLGPNEVLHAAFLYVSATLDHVVPHSRGGTNDPDNLVTACWPCNFGRGGYLLEQMGLNDPRKRPPVRDGWDGLTRVLRRLSAAPRPAAAAGPRRAQSQSPRKPLVSASEWLSEVSGIADDTPDRALAFLASCEGLPVSWSARDVLILRMEVEGRTLQVFGFERTGSIQIPWAIGDAKPAFRGFAKAIADAIPGAIAYETPKTWSVRHIEKRLIHLEELLQAAKVVRDALERLQSDLLIAPAPNQQG